MRRVTVGFGAFVLALAGGVVLNPTSSNAAPVQWSGNGHWYEAISVPGGVNSDGTYWGGIAWTAASDAAVLKGGYLATIASSEENSFVFSLVGYSPDYWHRYNGFSAGPWLGGYQDPPNTSDPSANWKWVSGEAWTFTNWGAGEPNDHQGQEESSLQFYCWDLSALPAGQYGAPLWNDATNYSSGAVRGYIVEYETAPIPEPAAVIVWSLLGASGVTIGWSRRRKRAG